MVGEIDAYCKPPGSKYDQRYFPGLSTVAFNDPNDTLSYAIPAQFESQHIDSRSSQPGRGRFDHTRLDFTRFVFPDRMYPLPSGEKGTCFSIRERAAER